MKRLSKRSRELVPSGIREFFDIAATLPDVIALGTGDPDFTTPAPIIDAAVESLRQGETHYTSNSGTIELRRALSWHLDSRYNVSYDPDKEVLITVGVSEALQLVFQALIDPGDEVIVVEPCFVSFKPAVILAGGVPVTLETKMEDNFRICPDAICRLITPRTRAILLSSPNNPTGAVLTKENLIEIGEAARKNDILIITDEIYDRLVFDQSHVCIPSLPNLRDRTILLGGFSKAYAMTGWRIGYAAGPAELMEGLHRLHQYIIMSAPTIAQHAALAALQKAESYVREMKATYKKRRRILVEGLRKAGLNCPMPGGAFYVFPSIRRTGLTDTEFSRRLLLEEQVAVVPGSAFGACGARHVRATYVTSTPRLQEAVRRICRFTDRIFGKGTRRKPVKKA